MATQERVQKQKTERKSETTEAQTADTKKVDAEKLKADLDAILDEIDEVLEHEAAADGCVIRAKGRPIMCLTRFPGINDLPIATPAYGGASNVSAVAQYAMRCWKSTDDAEHAVRVGCRE